MILALANFGEEPPKMTTSILLVWGLLFHFIRFEAYSKIPGVVDLQWDETLEPRLLGMSSQNLICLGRVFLRI